MFFFYHKEGGVVRVMKIVMNDVTLLRDSLDAINGLINEATFEFTPQGLVLKAIDPAVVAMTVLQMLPTCFAQYQIKNNVKLMVGYPYRFNKIFCDLKDQLDDGILGDIQTAHAVNNAPGAFMHRGLGSIPMPVPEWWFNKELTGGGALIDLGSHMINLARWYFGEVTSIKAHLGYRFNFDFEDHAICIAHFASGTKAIINVGWFSQKSVVGTELFGTVAHAKAHHYSPGNLGRVKTGIELLLGRIPDFFMPYYDEVSHFVNCINEDTFPSPSGDDAYNDLEALLRAYKNPIALD